MRTKWLSNSERVGDPSEFAGCSLWGAAHHLISRPLCSRSELPRAFTRRPPILKDDSALLEAATNAMALRQITRTLAACSRPTRHFSATASSLKDPWPLPHSPEHLASTASSPNTPPPEPLPRPGELVETMRARLVYQSRKRGTLESDLLLSTFAKEQLPLMGEAELKEFDKVRFPSWYQIS